MFFNKIVHNMVAVTWPQFPKKKKRKTKKGGQTTPTEKIKTCISKLVSKGLSSVWLSLGQGNAFSRRNAQR